ncbi:unnamed protein product [Sphagnum balticum]
MPIEIVPAGATAVVTEKHEHSKNPNNWDLANQAERNFDQMVEDVKESATATALAAATNTASIKESVGHGSQESRKEYGMLQKQVSDFYSSVLIDSAKNAAQLQVQSQQETNQLSDQATANFNLSSVQNQTNANLASVQALTFANAADVSRQKFGYEGQLQAQTIAAAAAAKAAECCCELKTAILADGQKTRDLLNSITEQNLRDRAQRSENALAAYFAAKVAPTSPIS